MIEKIVLDHLASLLEYDVVMERDGHDAPFILIQKTGGARQNHIEQASIAVQSYGRTLLEAAQMNEEIKTAVYSLTDNDSIFRASLNSDYNFTDTRTKDYRYQALFDIYYSEEMED